MLCKGRSWLVPIFSVGPTVRMACALPAMLLTVRQTDRQREDRQTDRQTERCLRRGSVRYG